MKSTHGAVEITRAEFKTLDPEQIGLVIVRDNTFFEAAAFMYSRREMDYWLNSDPTPFRYYKMDLNTARYLANYKG